MATPEYPAFTDAAQRVLASLPEHERCDRALRLIRAVTRHAGNVAHSPNCAGHDCAGCASDRVLVGNVRSVIAAADGLGVLGVAA